MKKMLLALALAVCLLLSLAACGKTPAEDPGVVDPGNEPAAPGEGPEMDMPAVMPEVSDTDLPEVDIFFMASRDLLNWESSEAPFMTDNGATWEKFADAFAESVKSFSASRFFSFV